MDYKEELKLTGGVPGLARPHVDPSDSSAMYMSLSVRRVRT